MSSLLTKKPNRGQSQDCPLLIRFTFQDKKLIQVKLAPSHLLEIEISGDCPDQQALYDWLEDRKNPFPFELFYTLTPFTEKVLTAMQTIPYGSCATYSEIAQKIGHPGACRAVGNSCRANPFPLVIPCHRVVGKNRKLGGFAYGKAMKKQLLDFENSKRL